jgi:hypothetical protein
MKSKTLTNYGRTLLFVLTIVLSTLTTGCSSAPTINREYGHWTEVTGTTFLGGKVSGKIKFNSSLSKFKKGEIDIDWPHGWFGG